MNLKKKMEGELKHSEIIIYYLKKEYLLGNILLDLIMSNPIEQA